MNALKTEVETKGFTILRDVFTNDEIVNVRHAIEGWCKTHNGLPTAGGISIPDFIKIPDFISVTTLKDNATVNAALIDILGNKFRFCSHNDIGIARAVGWHKDKLNGPYAKYQKTNIWKPNPNGDKHDIVKVLIYLQDQHDKETSLFVVPGSHTNPSMDTRNAKQVSVKSGDVVIFDQRITHRGAHKSEQGRILVSFGFGKNNVFTDEFEAGTVARQTDQTKQMR
jgi:hypothetical protein